MTDIEQALSEIKRRAERTDLYVWTAGLDAYSKAKCICITEDALLGALKKVFGDDSVLDPEPSQHTP